MKELFTIGEMAELFDINIRTLRYYDEIGILHPEQTEPMTGYRYYSTRQFERLNTIKYLRALDMPLKKIGLFFENRDVDVLRGLLTEQMEKTQERIRALKRIERKIENRLEALDDAVGAALGEIRLVGLAKRRIAFLRKDISLEDDLEYPIRELERVHLLEPALFLGKVGVSISRNDLEKGRFGRFSGIFLFLEEERCRGEISELQEGEYMTLRFSGTHREAEEHYRRLLGHMAEQGYVCRGDSVEVTLIDAGYTNDTSQYVTELQIPVQVRNEK